MTATQANSAYQASAAHRSWREQEADIFRRLLGALRAARSGNEATRIRALADNHRLWTAVTDLVRDPENKLPARLRAAIVSVGLAVQREMETAMPDLDFLISVNESIAAGLSDMG